ncbi:MAG TPA: GNAT family N-acetyltransferase [Candidatus Limnocylindrales bacterium]|nr:GNAT family N-acetyltransferase [Candidatus Limnocylindrales bacterium]
MESVRLPFRPAFPIRTERLVLRPFLASDFDAVYDIESRPEVVRYLMWDVMDRDAVQVFLERRLRQTAIEAEDQALLVAITVPPSDRVIGEIMLRLSSAQHRQGEIGWSLHPDAQGHGYATEAARAVLRMAFDDLKLHRVAADADPRNTGSLKIMERLGMRHEALYRENYFLKGEWVDETHYAILEDEWRALRAR